MSRTTCSVCSRPLENGACPQGHPQRAVRARRRAHRRRWPRRLALPVLLVMLFGLVVYATLSWYPARTASRLIDAASDEFVAARRAYLAVVNGFPSELNAETIEQAAGGLRESVGTARPILVDAQLKLEAREPLNVPIIRGRGPLPITHKTRQRMIDFYIGGQELITDIESIAGYLTELAPVLQQADELTELLGNPKTSQAVDEALVEARPAADELVTAVDAITAPVELGSVHEAAKAIATRIRADLDELDDITGRGAQPILETLARQIAGEIESFRETVLTSPREARQAGLSDRIKHLERLQTRIIDGLAELRDVGLPVTVPAA